jgi:uncharacterized protein
VVTLASLSGYDIADFSVQLGRHWGIGQKGKNNGVLLVVAAHERKVRIEVGYGLEGDLTDAVCKLIIENAILPRFRAGDVAGGISRGVDDIVQVLTGDAPAFKERAARRPDGRGSPLALLLFLGPLALILVASSFARRRRGWMWGGGWGGSSWGSGGGWSGGGGGFSGGGGSFGGGGASGGW